MKSCARQRQHDLAPAVGQLRESVEQKNTGVACGLKPGLQHMHREAIDVGDHARTNAGRQLAVGIDLVCIVCVAAHRINTSFHQRMRNLSLTKLISQPRAHEELPARPAAICRLSGYIGTAKRGPIERSQGESATKWSRVHQGKRRRQNHLHRSSRYLVERHGRRTRESRVLARSSLRRGVRHLGRNNARAVLGADHRAKCGAAPFCHVGIDRISDRAKPAADRCEPVRSLFDLSATRWSDRVVDE